MTTTVVEYLRQNNTEMNPDGLPCEPQYAYVELAKVILPSKDLHPLKTSKHMYLGRWRVAKRLAALAEIEGFTIEDFKMPTLKKWTACCVQFNRLLAASHKLRTHAVIAPLIADDVQSQRVLRDLRAEKAAKLTQIKVLTRQRHENEQRHRQDLLQASNHRGLARLTQTVDERKTTIEVLSKQTEELDARIASLTTSLQATQASIDAQRTKLRAMHELQGVSDLVMFQKEFNGVEDKLHSLEEKLKAVPQTKLEYEEVLYRLNTAGSWVERVLHLMEHYKTISEQLTDDNLTSLRFQVRALRNSTDTKKGYVAKQQEHLEKVRQNYNELSEKLVELAKEPGDATIALMEPREMSKDEKLQEIQSLMEVTDNLKADLRAAEAWDEQMVNIEKTGKAMRRAIQVSSAILEDILDANGIEVPPQEKAEQPAAQQPTVQQPAGQQPAAQQPIVPTQAQAAPENGPALVEPVSIEEVQVHMIESRNTFGPFLHGPDASSEEEP